MAAVPIVFSGCRNYSNRRKAGNVCRFPRAQAGTDRLPLMMARSVTLSSHPLEHTKHKHRCLTTSVCWLTACRGSVDGVGRGGRGGEFSILTAWWTNLSFSLLVLPQSLYTFLPDGNRKLRGRWVGLLGCWGHSGASLKSKHLGWRGKWHDNSWGY